MEKVGYVLSESLTASMPEIKKYSSQTIKITAELQEAERPNRNNRIYTKKAINDALNHYSVKEKIDHKTFYGK